MSDVALLRAKALAYKPTFELAICLNEELREAIDRATEKLTGLHAEKQQAKERGESGRRTIADPDTKDLWAAKIAEAEAAVEAAEQAAAEESVLVVWKRKSPDVYQAVLDVVVQETESWGEDFSAIKLADRLMPVAYDKCTSTQGEDLEFDWDTARGLLSHFDYDLARAGVVTLHRAGTSLDPTQWTISGRSKQT